jgi:Arc/MetJ-type ribon-helix-helix transcriptional regulator
MHKRITVSLPEDLVEKANEAVAAGRARSVSAYVAAAIEAVPVRETGAEVLKEWLAEHGPLTPEDEAWIEGALAAAERAAAAHAARQ